MRAVSGNEALRCLGGGHLDTVSFVMDYVEFRIDHDVLRALTNPVVYLPGGPGPSLPRNGARDALCTLIGTHVVAATEVGNIDADGGHIEVCTNAGHRLVLPLDADSLRGPEGAHLVPADREGRLSPATMYIW